MSNIIQSKQSLSLLLVECADLFEKNEKFAISDDIIFYAIEKFRSNDSFNAVKAKAMLINLFYSTSIGDINKMAKHIHSLDIDNQLTTGKLSLIDDIRRGHRIKVRKSGRDYDFYSFSTKYAALHEPNKYPIYDNLVMRLLSSLNKQFQFLPRFTQPDLLNYRFYVSAINALRVFVGLENYEYKIFDQGLWIYGKFLYQQQYLSGEDIRRISNSLKG